ncbi:MAG: YceI family protein [Saprospiraceae bacterium]|nr:YceI family protein [Saprospiraceae bacterium]
MSSIHAFILPILLMMGLSGGHERETWLLQSHSRLKVDGKTNINSFECAIPSYGRRDTLYVDQTAGSGNEVKTNGELAIQVRRFDCHHKVMTKDLQKTLKADDYPYMKISFLSFSKGFTTFDRKSHLSGTADITLAGVTKRMDITFVIDPHHKDGVELVGTKLILFSDFKLKPPSKLGGAIKVKNELIVEFVLFLQKVS